VKLQQAGFRPAELRPEAKIWCASPDQAATQARLAFKIVVPVFELVRALPGERVVEKVGA
jgi:hypothetical protein